MMFSLILECAPACQTEVAVWRLLRPGGILIAYDLLDEPLESQNVEFIHGVCAGCFRKVVSFQAIVDKNSNKYNTIHTQEKNQTEKKKKKKPRIRDDTVGP